MLRIRLVSNRLGPLAGKSHAVDAQGGLMAISNLGIVTLARHLHGQPKQQWAGVCESHSALCCNTPSLPFLRCQDGVVHGIFLCVFEWAHASNAIAQAGLITKPHFRMLHAEAMREGRHYMNNGDVICIPWRLRTCDNDCVIREREIHDVLFGLCIADIILRYTLFIVSKYHVMFNFPQTLFEIWCTAHMISAQWIHPCFDEFDV